jgi:hypothetical protein
LKYAIKKADMMPLPCSTIIAFASAPATLPIPSVRHQAREQKTGF